jgi:imidazoleglycerol phosphate synthase glutamine amidotransferase subunit HisH
MNAERDSAAGGQAAEHDALAPRAGGDSSPAAGAAADRRPAVAGRRVAVVDAGVGNLGNLVRALEHLGAVATVTREPREVAAARCLVLPGVGAFAPPREALRGPLEAALGEALAGGAWLLGICVGFQLLFAASEEFGVTDGLGLLPGRVTRLPTGVPVPHIGWNRLHDLADHPLLAGLHDDRPRAAGSDGGREAAAGGAREGAAGGAREGAAGGAREGAAAGAREAAAAGGLDAAAPGAGRRGRHFYFVHGYAPDDVPAEVCLARATHGRAFAAVAGRGRVMGTQFHPERSGEAGLRLLANFLEIADGAAAGY